MQTATEESLEIKPQQLNDFNIDLEFFSGPMDLLLHLVQQQEVSIEQVSMSVITRQYLEIVHRAQFLDIEKASEYLVIAATLLSIKSQSLLPSSDLDSSDLVEEERNEKFYEELREQLKAYQLAKARAQALINTPQLGV
nr:segregation/condensation protein A [Pseudomonadota bacterium]